VKAKRVAHYFTKSFEGKLKKSLEGIRGGGDRGGVLFWTKKKQKKNRKKSERHGGRQAIFPDRKIIGSY